MRKTMARAVTQKRSVDPDRQSRDHFPKGPKQIDVHVGAKIRERRKELGISQTALGNKVGVAFQQIQKYENGANRVGASRLAAIAKVLEVRVDHFFPDDTKQKSPSGENIPAQIAALTRRIKFLTRERDRLQQLL
jgi:transcriptional regulator with XRE-family HTH domain